MLNNGVPLEVVSATLGHAGLAITADVYAKVRPELQRTAATAMERVLGGGGLPTGPDWVTLVDQRLPAVEETGRLTTRMIRSSLCKCCQIIRGCQPATSGCSRRRWSCGVAPGTP